MPVYCCPLCHTPLTCEPTRWYCAHNHSFDVAKQGYINLLPVQHKKTRQPGDDALMIEARAAFLGAGHYAPLRDAIAQLIAPLKPKHLLDIGCGDGYYTQALAAFSDSVTAIDLSLIHI